MSNAIKFTPNGGRIYVTLERVDRHAQITIRDTGQGIDSELLPFVFERFRQGDGSITRQYGGLGLGLSIARQLVEAHGGTITAESQGQDQGATFTVRLPLVSNSPAFKLSIAPTMQRFDLSGIRILVAEDEPATLKFLAFVLEQEGATVTAVTSAQAALDALEFSTLEQSCFDVLVCDIGMQEMDGYALLRQIRSSTTAAYQNIYAIALTAYATEVNRQQALVAGFQQHLAKPIEPAMLIAAIATEVRQCG